MKRSEVKERAAELLAKLREENTDTVIYRVLNEALRMVGKLRDTRGPTT